jgi:hypothetical protein
MNNFAKEIEEEKFFFGIRTNSVDKISGDT